MASLIGLGGSALVAVTALLLLLRVRRRRLAARLAVAAGLAALLALPVEGLPLASYVRGVIGDLSVTTLLLLAFAAASELLDRDFLDHRNRSALMIAALAGGLLLYPFALGVSPFDPYALGFGSRAFQAALLAAALVAWRLDLHAAALGLSLAVAAYALGLLESNNLWDYLIDPVLVMISVAWLAGEAIRRLRPAHAGPDGVLHAANADTPQT